jgi:heme exporter protein A
MLEGLELACVRGERTLFGHLNFTLGEGEILLVQGANGSGKTSLLRMVCGLLTPAFGEVRWFGENMAADRESFHADLTYLGHMPAVKDDLTAAENLQFACRLSGEIPASELVESALAHLGLSHCMDLPVKVLSQGQRRRVALARLLMAKTRLWVLDEPLAALDQSAVRLVESLLGEHLRKGGMALLTTHQPVAIANTEPKMLSL